VHFLREPKINQMNIGDNIRKIRLIRNYSQQGFAALLGKTRSWVCKLEAGQIDPKLSTLSEISEKCKIDLVMLVADRVKVFTPQNGTVPGGGVMMLRKLFENNNYNILGCFKDKRLMYIRISDLAQQ
jgi:transcriptional regulator with XRE-family HTH domain